MEVVVSLANESKWESTGESVRPIGSGLGCAVREQEACMTNGCLPSLLDIVSVELEDGSSESIEQPENRKIRHGSVLEKKGKWDSSRIAELIETPDNLWVAHNEKETHRILPRHAEGLPSLYFVKPDNFEIQLSKKTDKKYGKDLIYNKDFKQEAIFEYNKIKYKLPCTECLPREQFFPDYNNLPIEGTHSFPTNVKGICVSLGETYRRYRYKFVASVICGMNDAIRPILYTIGHSTHEWSRFVELLKMHSIKAIADVRSSPFSKYRPQFNWEFMKPRLKAENIHYLLLGEELGAQRTEPECYRDNHQVDFALVAETDSFKKGLKRLRKGAEKMNVAIMCAEKDPLTCHRTILVARHGADDFSDVHHILEDGSIERRSEAEERLLEECKLNQADLFEDFDEQKRLAIAYQKRAEKIAYKK